MNTPRPSSPARPRRAAVDQNHLRKILSLQYGADGQPSPILRKSIDHFKDRFREVLKNVQSSLSDGFGAGNKAPRPSSHTLTSDKGCDVTIEAEWPLSLSDKELKVLSGYVRPDRMLTPTMKQAGFLLESGLPDIEALSKTASGLVGISLISTGNKLHLTAAMIFHHPTDKYVLADEDTAFPSADVTLSDGATVFFDADQGSMKMRSVKFVLGTGRPALIVTERKTPEGASKMHLLAEAAQSSRATYDSIKALAERTFSNAFEIMDISGALNEQVGRATEDLSKMVLMHVTGCLHLGEAKVTKYLDFHTLAGHLDLDAARMDVEAELTTRTTHSRLFSLKLRGEFQGTFYRHLGSIRDSFDVELTGGPYDLMKPGTVDEVLRAVRPRIRAVCDDFLKQCQDRKTRFDQSPY